MYNTKIKIYDDFVRVYRFDTPTYGKSKLSDKRVSSLSDRKEGVEQLEEMSDKTNASLRISGSRTRQNVFDYALANAKDFSYFVTLTFNPQYVNSFSYDDSVQAMSNWLKNFKKRHASDLKYIGVPEKHKSGRYHFHFLMSADIGSCLLDSGRTDERGHTIYNVGKYKLGWSTAIHIYENGTKLAGYLMKYISKDLLDSIPNKKRYWHSLNLSKPEEVHIFSTCDDIESLGKSSFCRTFDTFYGTMTISEYRIKMDNKPIIDTLKSQTVDVKLNKLKLDFEEYISGLGFKSDSSSIESYYYQGKERLNADSSKYDLYEIIQAQGWQQCYECPFV